MCTGHTGRRRGQGCPFTAWTCSGPFPAMPVCSVLLALNTKSDVPVTQSHRGHSERSRHRQATEVLVGFL